MTPSASDPSATEPPLVSVVVPTRDRPERLEHALASIAAQDYAGRIETVVVFDRSEPTTLAAGTAERRTVAIVNDRTPGPAGARNAGAERATGELLAFLDDDDEWLPSKLRAQVEVLARTPGANTVTCGVTIDHGDRLNTRVAPHERITGEMLVRERMTSIHTSTLLVRRGDFVDAIGPFDESMPAGYGEDYEWLLRAARSAPIAAIRSPLVRVAWHEGSWFDARWDTWIAAIRRLLETHPEIERSRPGLSRLYGKLAFAHAASDRPGPARRWALKSMRLDPREPRGYLAVAISWKLVRASTVLRLAHDRGKGI